MIRWQLLSTAALLSLSSASALLWHPKNPKNAMWDTWLFVQPGQDAVPKFYMNYLSSCDASCGGSPSRDPAGCCSWNGVGATTSDDGVHYEDQGIIFTKDPDAAWLGSGSILKNSAGEYVMNFSQEYDCQPTDPKNPYGTGGCQSIFFATSKDLKNWTRVAFKPPAPGHDTEVFKYSDGGLGGATPGYTIGGRWDTIATVPKPGFPGIYYGFWTASPSGHGGAGVGETTDQTGHHWKALPPITADGSAAGFPAAEVGSTVVLDGKYYMLFGGGHIYSSDNPITGYKPEPKNFDFHTDGDGVAFSRLWNVQGNGATANESTVLISHQWMTNGMTGSAFPGAMGSKGIYLAPLKEMKVGTDGTPRAVYWSGNEKLKGDSITLGPLPPPAPPAPPGTETIVDVASCGGGTTTWQVPAVGAAAGPIALKSSSPPGSACLGIENINGTDALVLSNCSSGAAQFAIQANGSITSGHGCGGLIDKVSFKYAPGNVFPTDPNHGVRLVDRPAQCCALCQSLKNCSFWTWEHGGTAAQPNCYNKPGGCCFLKTAAAKGAPPEPNPSATSGSSEYVPYCMDAQSALPRLQLRMAACDGTATSQDWSTAGGIIKEVKSAAPGQCLRTSTFPAPPTPAPPGVLFDVEVDLTVGVVIEATLSCTHASTSAGFWVHDSKDAFFVWNCATQTFTVGGQSIDRQPGFAAGAAVALKMLLRTTPNGERGMAEFYANEIMSHPFTFSLGGGKAAKFGVAALNLNIQARNADIAAVTAVKAWKMTLSSDQESLA